VISVILYHAHLGFPGGYVGVDVFFVISGFLITSILLKKLKNGTFSYLNFWERRVRRLVPALFVVTVVTALASYFLLLPEDLMDLGGALIAQPLLLVNVYFWRVVKGGYFGDPPEIRPLLHTWSLGVEEQFYVFFPLLLMAVWSKASLRPKLSRILLGAATLSFVLGVVLTPIKGVAAFFNLPTRAWELLLGSLIVFLPEPSQRYRSALSWVGTFLVSYSIFEFNKETPFPGTAALVPCLGSLLLIWSNGNQPDTMVGKLLAKPLMVKIGLASYSLYLWHWPLMAFADYTGLMGSTGAKAGVVALSLSAGFLSWRYIETPFRDKRLLRTGRTVILLFLSYFLVCSSIGIWYRANGGFSRNWNAELLEIAETGKTRKFLYEHNPGTPGASCKYLGDHEASGGIDFILWGDSHAMSMAALLDSLGHELNLSGLQLTASASRGTLGYVKPTNTQEHHDARAAWKAEIIKAVAETKARALFICGYWQAYQSDSLQRELRETIEEINSSSDISIYVILDNPKLVTKAPFRTQLLSARWPLLKSRSKPVAPEEHEAKNRDFESFAETLKGCQTIEIAPTIFQWKKLVSNGKGLYFDQDHLSDYGALHLKDLFLPILRKLTPDTPTNKK